MKNVYSVSLTSKWSLSINLLWIITSFLLFSCSSSSPEVKDVEPAALVQIKEMPPQPTIDSSITIDYLMGKFDPSKDDRFVLIDPIYADQKGRLLRIEAYEAFKSMHSKAKAEGINLKIKSATRNFMYQKGIWERKWMGKTKVAGEDLSETLADPKARALKILQYSSMPGSSRHHWGTDFDLNNFNNSYFENGQGKKEYDWLAANAGNFGFCQPYSPKGTERPNGYNEEKWHWSFLPLAKTFTEQAKLRLQDSMLTAFLGAESAVEIGVVNNYILGINPNCLK